MKKTTYFNFNKPELTDIVGPEDFNDNSDKLDKILYNSTRLEVANGTANALTLTEVILEDKTMKNFIAKVNNDASVATTINGKNVYRASTTKSPTFISGKAYCVWYDKAGDCFFTRANAEGDVDASEVLAGKYFSNDKDTHIKGTMPNNPSINAALNCSESINIPKGYTPGGVVKTNSLASQTSGTATAPNIGKGLTAWVNGKKLTGTGDILKTKTITMKASDFSYKNNSGRNGYTIYLNNVFSATNMSGVTTMLYGEVTGSITYSYYYEAHLKTDGSRTFTQTYGKTSTFHSDSFITLVSYDTGRIGSSFDAFITRNATFTLYYI